MDIKSWKDIAKHNTNRPDVRETGICPDCGSFVEGVMNWNKLCMTTFCKKCDKFLLESEVDWGKPNIRND